MYLLEAPTETVADLREAAGDIPTNEVGVSPGEVRFDLVGTNSISLAGREVRATPTALQAFGKLLGVPAAFLLRQDPDLQQHILGTLLTRRNKGLTALVTDEGITDVLDQGVRTIPVSRLLDVAVKVAGRDAKVRDYVADQNRFRLDLFAEERQNGDSAIGDMTAAGIRMLQDRKHNLAPQVQPFTYRLFCTNGMSQVDAGLRVDARGSTVEEVLAEFESMAELAFSRAEQSIAAFYEMRTQPVDNPERTLLRMAEEMGLPSRTIVRMQERIPTFLGEGDDDERAFSMFDMVNLVTNEANNPSVRSRQNSVLALQGAGAQMVSDHAERCGTCQSRLTH